MGNIGGTGTNHVEDTLCDNVNNVNRSNSIWYGLKQMLAVHIYEIVNDAVGHTLKVFTGVTINTNAWHDNKVMYKPDNG
jgi:hypothetical protein